MAARHAPPAPPPRKVLLTRGEAAAILGVQDPQQVTRMADKGRIWSTRTLGGHRRFDAAEIRTLAAGRARGTAS